VLLVAACAPIRTSIRETYRVVETRRLAPRPAGPARLIAAGDLRGDSLVVNIREEGACVVPVVERRQVTRVEERTGAMPIAGYEVGVGIVAGGAGAWLLADPPRSTPERDPPGYDCDLTPDLSACRDRGSGFSPDAARGLGIGLLVLGGAALTLAIVDGVRAIDSEEDLGVRDVEVAAEPEACGGPVTSGVARLDFGEGDTIEARLSEGVATFPLTTELVGLAASRPTPDVRIGDRSAGTVTIPDTPAILAARARVRELAGQGASRARAAENALPALQATVRERVGAADWDGAVAAVTAWRGQYGATPSAGRIDQLVRSIERARALAAIIDAREAKRLSRPLRRYVLVDNTRVRSVPELDVAMATDSGTLNFGGAVDIWYTADGGWLLVAPPDAQATGGSLMSITGWVRDSEITRRDVGAGEQRRIAAAAEREERRQEAEAAREARRREAEARREEARRAREQAANEREPTDLQSYLCYRDCMARSCPGFATCVDRCGDDVDCVRSGGLGRCMDAVAPCSHACRSRCGLD
jgi:hypothetical protein